MVSAKRIEAFDFATMYTNLSLNVVLDNLKMVIKKSLLLSSKSCFKTTVNSRCYRLDMIFDLLEFVLYNTYIRFNGNLYKQIVGIPMEGGNASPFIYLADLFLSQL